MTTTLFVDDDGGAGRCFGVPYDRKVFPAAVVARRAGPILVLADHPEALSPSSDALPPWKESLVGFDRQSGVVPAVVLASLDAHVNAAEVATAAALASSSQPGAHLTTLLAVGAVRDTAWRDATSHVRVEAFVPGARLQRFLRKLEPLDGRAPPSLSAYIGRALVGACVDVAAVPLAGTTTASLSAPGTTGTHLLLRLEDVHVGFDGIVRALPRFDSFLFTPRTAALPEVLRAQLTSMQRLNIADATADSWRIGKVMHAVLAACAPPPALLLKLIDDALQPTTALRPSLPSFAARLDEILAHDPFGAAELAGLVSSTLANARETQLAFIEAFAMIDREFVRVPAVAFASA